MRADEIERIAIEIIDRYGYESLTMLNTEPLRTDFIKELTLKGLLNKINEDTLRILEGDNYHTAVKIIKEVM